MGDLTPPVITEQDVKEPNLLLRALRKIVQRITSVSDRVSSLEKAPAPSSIQDISRQLQASGGAPLTVTGLPGVLAQPQLAGAPRLLSDPAGQVLQQYKDTQLIVVGTTSTGFALNTVVGGNPNSLYRLIGGLTTSASAGNFMTLDTVQTSTGNKTLTGNWTFDGTLTATSTAVFKNATYSGLISNYHGVNTAGEGVPYIVAIVTTSTSAAIAGNTIYSTPASGSGLYRAGVYLNVPTAGASTAVSVYVGFTDDLGLPHTIVSGPITTTTTLSSYSNTFTFTSTGSVNITYSSTVSGATGTYAIRLALERLT